MECNDDDVSLQALGEVCSPKDSKGKDAWLVLVQGSLFWYKSSALTNMKGDLSLNNTKSHFELHHHRPSVIISLNGKPTLVLSFGDEKTAKEWAEKLNVASSLNHGSAPQKKKEQLHLGTRMQKAVAGKVAASGAGKMLTRAVLNEEGKTLVNAVKTLVTQTHDAPTANNIEKNVVKLLVKYYYLVDDGRFNEDAWTVVDPNLRKAFEQIVKLSESALLKQPIKPERVTAICELLRTVEKQLHLSLRHMFRRRLWGVFLRASRYSQTNAS